MQECCRNDIKDDRFSATAPGGGHLLSYLHAAGCGILRMAETGVGIRPSSFLWAKLGSSLGRDVGRGRKMVLSLLAFFKNKVLNEVLNILRYK